MQTLHIGSPEAFRVVEPGLDQAKYRTFLEQVRLVARIEPGQDDANITIAERLADTGLTDDEALRMAMSGLERASS